jgi:protein-S-isoprenylcysteine O-methyltransferase Ste14
MWQRTLAFASVLFAAGAPAYFFVFWHWFDFWRTRWTLWCGMLLTTFGCVAAIEFALRRWMWAGRLDFPIWVRAIGWGFIGIVSIFGAVADRQIGIRVRSFRPFFEHRGRLDLKTTGAYGVVRHPIYAAGGGFLVGGFLVSGYPSVIVFWLIYTLGAVWFTGQEERRIVALLDDPAEYDRYRARVPALFPRLRRA